MKRGIAAALAGSLTCVASTDAFGWGETGHRVIGQLASEQLTPKARAAVEDIIATGNPGNAGNCPSKSLADMAEWPDCVRGNPAYKAWTSRHFADIPLCGPPDSGVYCRNGACVTVALRDAEAALRNPASSQREKFKALAELAHFIGDIHQPLHVTDNADRGGNEIRVTGLGEQNLHHTWDTTLVAASVGSIETATKALRPAVARHRTDWAGGSYDNWAAESHKVGVDTVYKTLPSPPACGAHAPTENLGSAYFSQAKPMVKTQLVKASVRLSAKLNDIYR